MKYNIFNKEYRKLIFLTMVSLIFSLLLSSIVSAGVTNPLPSNMELTPGESGRFKFQIQATQSESDLICNFNFESEPIFKVNFDQEEVLIKSKSIQDVYGTITPSGLSLGNYNAEFCVVCDPVEKQSGASVKIDTCGLSLNVNLVETRTRDNLYVPPKSSYLSMIVFVLMILVIIVLIVIIVKILLKRRSYSKQETVTTSNTIENSVTSRITTPEVKENVFSQQTVIRPEYKSNSVDITKYIYKNKPILGKKSISKNKLKYKAVVKDKKKNLDKNTKKRKK